MLEFVQIETGLPELILALVAGVFFASFFLPIILRVAIRRRLYDTSDFRKVHHGDVPRLGGVSFMPSIVMALLTVSGIDVLIGDPSRTLGVLPHVKMIIFSALALTAIYGVGIADDIFSVRYRTKFGVQILCGILLLCGGIGIWSFYGVAGIGTLPGWAAWCFTILMTIFIINAMNLIDGIDGLSAMICQLAMVTYGVVAIFNGDIAASIVAAATFGVTIPFLRFNLFGKSEDGTKMFMGDTGSMTLGLVVAALGMKCLSTFPADSSINPVLVALTPIMVPCFDVVRVYCIRLLSGRSPFLPDRNHIHHRLLDLGLSQRQALWVIVGYSVAVTLLNVWLSTMVNVNVLLLGDVAIWLLSTMLVTRGARHAAGSKMN